MDRVHQADQSSSPSVRHVAVMLNRVGPDQLHIGILHCGQGDTDIRLIHLAWHHKLCNDTPAGRSLWIDPPIPMGRARQVAAFCRQVWRHNGRKIPYAFSTPNDCFDTITGALLLGGTTLGLTCATFVVAVFQATGLQMLDLQSWHARPEDVQWQQRTLSTLRDGSASENHIAALEQEIGAARYRPEEVAGAAAGSPWPVLFDDAAQNAERLVQLLDRGSG